jgi:hypothetical protein
LSAQTPTRPVFGLVAHGVDFIFLQLRRQEKSLYGFSAPFAMHREDDL